MMSHESTNRGSDEGMREPHSAAERRQSLAHSVSYGNMSNRTDQPRRGERTLLSPLRGWSFSRAAYPQLTLWAKDCRRSAAKNGVISLFPAALVLALLAGCAPDVRRPRIYTGPTLTMPALVAAVNERNAGLLTLYAKHYLEATIHNPETKKSNFINSGGDIFVRKPKDLLLRGRKDIVGNVFEIGSTDDHYWMSVFEGEDTMWWGWHRNAGKPCVKGMPIRPDALGEVLGIGQIDANLKAEPFPTMRFNNDSGGFYMLTWNARGENLWYTEKEVWYARETLLPVRVFLFDRNGRVILRANLSQHKPVELAGVAEADRPLVATYYDLFFPETESTMTIRLSDLAVQTRTGQPKPGMIRFPENPGVSKVMQIDADCEK